MLSTHVGHGASQVRAFESEPVSAGPEFSHFAGRRKLARSVPTMIVPVKPPSWAALL